jgi:DNA-binding transcriptional MerR regulator
VLARLRDLAQTLPDYKIAEQLTAEGLRTQTGKLWTYQRVAMIRKQHQIPTACPVDPGAGMVRGDGLLPVGLAAERLRVSSSLIHVWIQQGVLVSEQRTAQSYRWVRLTQEDLARLDGQHDWSQFPSVREVMRCRGLSREAAWALVRGGAYVAYRHAIGQRWEWRLQATETDTAEKRSADVV